MSRERSDGLIEDEFREIYRSWKANPSPDTNAAILKALQPTIEGAIQTHIGASNPNLLGRARIMALQGLRSYDPLRGRLRTHIYNQLLGLRRFARQQLQTVKVPERVSLDRHHLEAATRELENELGREPTDEEISDRTGISARRLALVRKYHPAVSESAVTRATNQEGVIGGVNDLVRQRDDTLLEIVYDELDPYHKKVMEYSLGLHGRRPLPNQDIAAKLRRSPGAISQAKLRIQKKLDEVMEMRPLL
jgi:DNA-directed RNA polymerase specialized sigma subunit